MLTRSINWIKTLHKAGDVINVKNYRTSWSAHLWQNIWKFNGMESKISACVEETGKGAYGQVVFHKHNSTTYNLVSLLSINRRNSLESWGFIMLLRRLQESLYLVNIFGAQMEEIKVASEYMLAISWIYEKVRCDEGMGNGISDFFNCAIGAIANDCQVCNGRRHWRSCHWECSNHAFVVCRWCGTFCIYFRRCAEAYNGIGRVFHAY
mgnify:CR=1 FL=1